MAAKSSMRTGAAALVESLEKAGAEVVFGYPGGNVVDVFDRLRGSRLRFVLGRHEQGCVHMADGYARASGRPAVVVVTSGPGLTNTITGLGAANMDGVPMVLVCGQVPLDQIGTDAFQEADTTGLTRAVSKHNFLVHSADEIPETVAQAFYIATHGKPGPVVIDVPRDCQLALTAAAYPARVFLRAYHPEVSATPSQVARLAKLVNGAKRPVILAGGGVVASGASGDVAALAHKVGIPVATTLMGIGSFDETDPLALGLAGLHGEFAANAAIAEADLLLALGGRFNDRVTGRSAAKFARRAKIVHVDCDPASINKNVTVDLGIIADVKELLMTVDSRIMPAAHDEWLAKIAAHRRPQGPRRRRHRRRPAPALGGEALPPHHAAALHQLGRHGRDGLRHPRGDRRGDRAAGPQGRRVSRRRRRADDGRGADRRRGVRAAGHLYRLFQRLARAGAPDAAPSLRWTLLRDRPPIPRLREARGRLRHPRRPRDGRKQARRSGGEGAQVEGADARRGGGGQGGRGMKGEIHRINCYVENKPGVLARIVGLISGRGYNIQTLNVGPTEDGTVSRMKIDVLGTARVVEQIILQLRNQVNVIEVSSRRR